MATTDGELVSLIHCPAHAPEAVVRDYPAHLHIDLLARARGRDLGRALVERPLADLRARGVRASTSASTRHNANAIAFYEHLGFREVAREPGGLLMGLAMGVQHQPRPGSAAHRGPRCRRAGSRRASHPHP